MSDYLLPCACGQKLPVSVRHAGHVIQCSCGARLEVPTLRGLAELEPAETAPAKARVWGDRQRVAFVLGTVALAAVALAGYLLVQLPPRPVPPELPDVDENSPIGEVLSVYRDLQRGLDAPPPTLMPHEQATAERHDRMLWGIAVALAVAACTAIGAAVVLFRGPQKR
jgi:hypothetical protein